MTRKTRIEILAECSGLNKELAELLKGQKTISVEIAIEAMKLAMEQSWLACYDYLECWTPEIEDSGFNGWLEQIEKQK